MNDAMEAGAGIYRSEDTLMACTETMQKIRERYKVVMLRDKSNVFNTDLVEVLELGAMIDVANAMACSALQRNIDYSDVTITRSQPAERVYGGAQE